MKNSLFALSLDIVASGVHAADIARLQRGVPEAAHLLPPERDAGDRVLQRPAQPRRHLPVHARRILVPGGITQWFCHSVSILD